jgi:nucleoside-diphosphate-sugar epimerase
MQFHFASDVARQFIEAALNPLGRAYVFNLGTPGMAVAAVGALIEKIKPGVKVTVSEQVLPFPESFDNTELKRHFKKVYETPLEEGIRQTITQFETCLKSGVLRVED